MKRRWVLAKISESSMLTFISEHQQPGASTLEKAKLYEDAVMSNPWHENGFRPLMVVVAENGERFLPL